MAQPAKPTTPGQTLLERAEAMMRVRQAGLDAQQAQNAYQDEQIRARIQQLGFDQPPAAPEEPPEPFNPADVFPTTRINTSKPGANLPDLGQNLATAALALSGGGGAQGGQLAQRALADVRQAQGAVAPFNLSFQQETQPLPTGGVRGGLVIPWRSQRAALTPNAVSPQDVLTQMYRERESMRLERGSRRQEAVSMRNAAANEMRAEAARDLSRVQQDLGRTQLRMLMGLAGGPGGGPKVWDVTLGYTSPDRVELDPKTYRPKTIVGAEAKSQMLNSLLDKDGKLKGDWETRAAQIHELTRIHLRDDQALFFPMDTSFWARLGIEGPIKTELIEAPQLMYTMMVATGAQAASEATVADSVKQLTRLGFYMDPQSRQMAAIPGTPNSALGQRLAAYYNTQFGGNLPVQDAAATGAGLIDPRVQQQAPEGEVYGPQPQAAREVPLSYRLPEMVGSALGSAGEYGAIGLHGTRQAAENVARRVAGMPPNYATAREAYERRLAEQAMFRNQATQALQSDIELSQAQWEQAQQSFTQAASNAQTLWNTVAGKIRAFSERLSGAVPQPGATGPTPPPTGRP